MDPDNVKLFWPIAEVCDYLDSERFDCQEFVRPFPKFEATSDVIYCYEKTLFQESNWLKDRYSWLRKKKDLPVIQPQYADFVHGNKNHMIIKCRAVDNEKLSKTVVVTDKFVLVRYFFSGDISDFKAPREKIQRIGEKDRAIVRDALVGRSIPDAHKYLQDAGYTFSLLQVRNQARFVHGVVKRKKAGKVDTDPSSLARVAKVTENCSFKQYSSDGSSTFHFIQTFPRNVSLYAAGCATKSELEDHKKTMTNLVEMEKTVARRNLRAILKKEENFVFPSGVYVDTTYNLCDAYTTIICGQLRDFRTKLSGKHRVVILAVMISGRRDQSAHREFANEFFDYFSHSFPNAAIPFVMTDSESSLKCYAERAGTVHLLCSVHVLDNFERASSVADFEKNRELVFGVQDGETLSRCLLGSLSRADFDKKMSIVLEKVSNAQRKWLKHREEDLFAKCSWRARLFGGFLFHFPSNNSMEAMNGSIKNVLLVQAHADKCAEQLHRLADEQYSQCLRSVHEEDVLVMLKSHKFPGGLKNSNVSKNKFLSYLGFQASVILSWDIPSKLLSVLNVDDCEETLHQSAKLSVNAYKNDFIVEEEDGLIHVKREDKKKILVCQKCRTSIYTLCIHQLTVLRTLDHNDRQLMLFRMSECLEKSGMRNLLTAKSNKTAGEKPGKRKFSRASKHNGVRAVGDVSLTSIPESSRNDTTDTLSIGNSTLSTGNNTMDNDSNADDDSINDDNDVFNGNNDSSISDNIVVGLNDSQSTSIDSEAEFQKRRCQILGLPYPTDSSTNGALDTSNSSMISTHSGRKIKRRRQYSPHIFEK